MFWQTKVEDAFQRLRMVETQEQANRVVSNERMWATLVTKRLLSGLHQYDEVHIEETGWKRTFESLPRRPAKSCYRPHTRRPVLPLHKASSESQQASWPTYSGASQPKQFLDAMCFVESLADFPHFWQRADLLHRCSFFPTNVLVRRKKTTDQWMLSCGNIDKGALLLWPLKQINATVLQPCCNVNEENPEASFKLQLIANLDEWEGQAMTWHGPAYFMCDGAAGKGAASSSGAAPAGGIEVTGAACVLDGHTAPLAIPALAASLGFCGMAAAVVKQMLQEYGSPVDKDADEFDIILHGLQYK